MKTENQSYATRYPEHEKMIQDGHQPLLEEAKKRGKEYGMDNLPGVNEPSLDPYNGFLPTGYKRMHAEVQQYLNPDMHRSEMKSEATAFDQKHTEVTGKIDALTHENKIAERELGGKVPEASRSTNLRRWLIVLGFFFGEFIFTLKTFEYMGDSLLTACGIALLMTICSYFLARYLIIFLGRAKTEGLRMYLAAGVCGAAGIALSVVMSLWRARVVNEMNGGVSVSPAQFVILNLCIFIVSMLLSYVYMPKKEESEADRELRAKFEQINTRKKEIEALASNRDALQAEHRKQILHHQEIISLSEHTTKRINTLYLESAESFRSALLAHRSDRLTPKCFYHPITDLFDVSDSRR